MAKRKTVSVVIDDKVDRLIDSLANAQNISRSRAAYIFLTHGIVQIARRRGADI